MAEGYARNGGTATLWPRDTCNCHPWKFGDVLGLRLDLTAGTLSADHNGQLLGIVAQGLPTGSTVAYNWYVTLIGAGTQMQIAAATPGTAEEAAKTEQILSHRAETRARIAALDAEEAAKEAEEARLDELDELDEYMNALLACCSTLAMIQKVFAFQVSKQSSSHPDDVDARHH